MNGSLAGKTMFISGASRGSGLAIALRAARDGVTVALIAKTAEPHPKLEGTVYTAAEAIEEAGGKALPVVGDIRDDEAVADAAAAAAERFGGIDICVNNASAINLQGIAAIEMKHYDLMQDINARSPRRAFRTSSRGRTRTSSRSRRRSRSSPGGWRRTPPTRSPNTG